MKPLKALRSGGVAALACAACCAPILIAGLGVTAGLALTAWLVIGIGAAVTVVVLGGGVIASRLHREHRTGPTCETDATVAVAPPTRKPRAGAQ